MNLRAGGAEDNLDAALAAVYQTHLHKLEKYFRFALRRDDHADDLAQETFIRAWRARDSFKGGAKVSTWVWSIAKNILLEHIRNQKNRPIQDEETIGGLISPMPPHLNDTTDCVQRGLMRFFKDEPERAHVIYLACIEGWTREELAVEIGRTVLAATEYLSQCKKKFRPYIEDCNGG